MRMEPFLDCMTNYNFSRAQSLALDPSLGGGWEGWFQIEMLLHLRSRDGSWRMEREKIYPHGGQRCDFYVERGSGGDPTYIELKCQLSTRPDSVMDALIRFTGDLIKQRGQPVQGFCLLACYGRWENDHINKFMSITSGCTRYVLHADPRTGANMDISSLNDGNIRSHMEQDNFFLIGAT